MATNPKTLNEKLTVYQNDSFNIWMQKTNIAAREQGDLNLLPTVILSDITSDVVMPGTVSCLLPQIVKTGVTLVGGSNQITLNTTSGIYAEMLITDGGFYIPQGTKVTNVISGTVIQISNNITGVPSGTHTVTLTSNQYSLFGTGTSFSSGTLNGGVNVGDTIKIIISGSEEIERKVVAISATNSLLVSEPFTSTFSGKVIHNVSVMSLVKSINSFYEYTLTQLRGILVKSIAMS